MPFELLANQREALRVLGAYTGNRFDVWALAGNAKASCRAHVMALIRNVAKVPQRDAGVTALRAALYNMLAIEGGCEAIREDNFKLAAKEIMGIVVFKVRTNHGTGWSVPQAPECPAFQTQAAAQRYADLRNRGIDHMRAWSKVDDESQDDAQDALTINEENRRADLGAGD